MALFFDFLQFFDQITVEIPDKMEYNDTREIKGGPAVLNIVLDPVLIFGLGMGIRGAAVATVLSQGVSCVWVIRFLTGKKTILRLKKENFFPGAKLILPCIALGLATFTMQASESVISVCFNSSLLKYGGDLAVGAMTILSSVMQFALLPLQGIAQGSQPITSYNFGAGNKRRTRQAFWFSVLLGTVVCAVCAAAIALFPDEIMHFFRDDAEVTRIGRQALLYACAVMPLMGYSTYVNQLYQCLGFHQAATLLASCRNGLLYVPLILLLPRMLGLPGVEMSQPGADLLTFVVSLPFQIWFFRHKLR